MLIDLYQLRFNMYIHILCLIKFKIYTLCTTIYTIKCIIIYQIIYIIYSTIFFYDYFIFYLIFIYIKKNVQSVQLSRAQ